MVCVIFNPTAKGEAAKGILARLKARNRSYSLRSTVSAGCARSLAKEAVLEGYDTIVAMGGDGTINEVLNGIADAPHGLARARLGVLPVGTVNVFARELGIPFHFERAWSVIERGREAAIDLPRIECQTDGQRPRCFAQMAGCGFDARAVQLMNWELKKKIGRFAYLVSGLQAYGEKPHPIIVSANGRRFPGELVLLGNGRFYAGPFTVFPRADLCDGLIDVCVFPKRSWFALMHCAFASFPLSFLRTGPGHHFQARSLTIEGPSDVPVQMDGEWIGHLPASCSIEPRLLRVVVP